MEGRKEMEEGRDAYFTDLLKQYERLVFSICYRMTKNYFDAEDLTQETFLALYQALPRFDRESPSAYVTQVAVHKCLDYLKQAERRTAATEGEELERRQQEGRDGCETDPANILLDRELEQELERCCRGLKPPYNEVAYQYYCQGSTAAQIAAGLGKSTKTVQTQLRRAKPMLQKIFRREGLV